MALIIVLNLVALAFAWFFSDAWSLRGRVVLTALVAAGWLVPIYLVADLTTAKIVFIVWQLALAVYFSFKLGIANQRASYGWGA
jgi:hypothetical protein